MNPLSGKTAIVTGGNRGIGRGIAHALARAGADVVIAARNLAQSTQVAAEIQALGRRALAVATDVTEAAQVSALIEQTEAAFGGLDILVNNAGILTVGTIETMEEAVFDELFAVNVKGMFLCCKAAIPALKRRGGGRIINLSSVAGKSASPTIVHYCASKSAIIGFTHGLAKELALDGITVNAICPGLVRTHMWDTLATAWALPGESLEESWARQQKKYVPQGHAQTAEDMGRLAVFFAAEPNITGQAWNVDGGLL